MIRQFLPPAIDMLKVVFDTVVFVRSLINPHNVCGRAVFAHYEDYQLFVSQPVLVEILEVLHRPELTRKFSTLENLDATRVIEVLAKAQVVPIPSLPSVSRDPKDDKFLATAEAAAADYLVSEDRDLLDLGEYRGIKIIDTMAFLSILEAEEGAKGS